MVRDIGVSNHFKILTGDLNVDIYHTLYMTTNLVNNKIYIGVHSTKNPNDSYLGSGTLLKKAVEKYGKDNFKKEILHICETRQEAFELETTIVDENFKNRVDTYNVDIGGEHGPSLPGSANPMFGKNHSEQTRQLISNKVKGKTGGIRSEYHRQRIIETNKTRILTPEGIKNRKIAARANIKKAIERTKEIMKDPNIVAERAKKCSETKIAKRELEPKRKWSHRDYGTILANCADIVKIDPKTKWSNLREIVIGRYSNHKGWFIDH